MPPFALEGESASLLYLINLTAGLLDGDGHLYEIHSRAGTRAVVTGQAASRFHPAGKSFCSQQWNVAVEPDAMLVVLPGPAIPYRGSRYFQRVRVSLAPSARICWSDIWLAGRYARGDLSEQFLFECLVQDFEVERDAELIYRDRFCWNGPWSAEQRQWHFGGGLAVGSLFATGDISAAVVPAGPGLQCATFPLESGDTCIRWCGSPNEVTRAVVRTSLAAAALWEGKPPSEPWLLNSTELAPNHWFSNA